MSLLKYAGRGNLYFGSRPDQKTVQAGFGLGHDNKTKITALLIGPGQGLARIFFTYPVVFGPQIHAYFRTERIL